MCAFGLHLAFPLTGWWWLAPVAIAGLVASWCSLAPVAAAFVGYLSGIVFFSFGFSWFGETAGSLLGAAAPLLDIGPALLEAFAFAFAALAASLAAQRCDARAVPFAAAAAFTVGELLRSSGVLGTPLEQLGVAMIDSPLRALAAFVGSYGVTFATALAGASLGWWILRVRDGARARTMLVAWAAVAAAAALAWTFWPARHLAPPTRRVAAVQGGIAQTLKMTPGGLDVAIDRYAGLTASLKPQHPTLVLWPETVILAQLNDGDARTAALSLRFAAIARDIDATLYAGALAVDPSRRAGVASYNALFVYDPHARTADGVAHVYRKEQLVPFAEYVPGPAWLRGLPYADQIGRYTPGTNPVETIDGATALICWESLFGDIAHARLRDDPSLFLVATDDAWFGTTEFPYEHAMAAQLRAVETGRWVLRAGATGISGIVAPDGRWTQRTALGAVAIVVGDVGAPVDVPYAHFGPTPVGVVLALIVVLPFVRLRGARA